MLMVVQQTGWIRILHNFSVYVSNPRRPVFDQEAHGFINFRNESVPGFENEKVCFIVRTEIDEDLFQLIDEYKLAELIMAKVQLALKMNIESIGLANGIDDGFNLYTFNESVKEVGQK